MRNFDRAVVRGLGLDRHPEIKELRDLSEEDRLSLLRLTEQVSRIAERLDRLDAGAEAAAEGGVFRFESPDAAFRAADLPGGDRLVRSARPSLPDPPAQPFPERWVLGRLRKRRGRQASQPDDDEQVSGRNTIGASSPFAPCTVITRTSFRP
mgnify:CR=1 FL=1